MNCLNLIKAIDAYLLKADDNLGKELEKEKFAEPKETVEVINSFEEDIDNELKNEIEEFSDYAEKSQSLENFKQNGFEKFKAADVLAVGVAASFADNIRAFMPKLIDVYIKQTDKELYLEEVSQRTTAWMANWGEELGEIMKLNNHTALEKLLTDGLNEGIGIEEFTRRIYDSGLRDTRWKARRVAVTEVLRSHSVARQESYMQSPIVTHKSWLHSGGSGIKPRDNHVLMSGQIVPKAEPFMLYGADGGVYYPQYPRDVNLPPGESINCHCVHTPIVNEQIIGMPLEERRALQQQAIDEMNADPSWIEELEAQNRAKAGIEGVSDWNSVLRRRFENFQQMSYEEQLAYLGKSKAKQAYVDAGFVTDGKILNEIKNKSFTTLKENGIIILNNNVRKEATVGTYTKLKNPNRPLGGTNGGRPEKGMHGESGLQLLQSKEFTYQINKRYVNGVRVGNIPEHKKPDKRIRAGQSWFPEDWTDDKIHIAGTYVVNNSGIDMSTYIPGTPIKGRYENVQVCVVFDNQGGGTIYPDVDQSSMGEWGQIE